jgi:protease-4
MKRVLLVLLVLIGVAALAVAGVAVLVGLVQWSSKGRVPSQVVLRANLEQAFVEYVPDDTTASLMFAGQPKIRDFVEALERAGADDRVEGLVARIGGGSSGLAITQEIRDAVRAFRERGKFAIAFSETFGEVSPGNSGYYLATAFDEIWMQPTGDVNLTGFIAESPFIRGMLGKLGMEPRFGQRYEYKNAMNMFTETSMTAAHRESMSTLLGSQFGQLVRGIAEAREMSEDEVRVLFDRGPLMGNEAVDAGIVDGLAYHDEIEAMVKEKAGASVQDLEWHTYLKRAGGPNRRGETIALIYGCGDVHRGESGYNPVFGDVSMGSDTVGQAFRDAIKDDDVRGILFRVDSPGGSAVASDVIWRETVRAREAGKPVVVSMGNVAGSGGYWVAMDAARIVAQPGTITASIGVLNGKFLTEGFWEDWLGITWDDVQTSAFSSYYSSSYDYTPEGRAYFESWLDRIYEEFTSRVAAGRKMPIEKVLEIAKGRIWTGEDALRLGLVDELGGFTAALRLLREEIGLPADAPIHLRSFPREKTTWEKLTSSFGETAEARAMARASLLALKEMQPLARTVRGIAAPPRRDETVKVPALPSAE